MPSLGNYMHAILRQMSLTTLFVSLVLVSQIVSAGGKLPELSADGLRLAKQDKFAAVYIKDGAAFGGYDKVAILDCTVEFRKNWQRDQNEDIPFSVKDKDVARIKAALAAEFSKVFSQELIARGETVVTEAGPNVLVLRPAIINLDISVPAAMERIDEVTLTTSAGQMTLYMELYDSTTNELLARVIDPEESRDFGNFVVRNEVTNLADANRILKKWADTLGDFLMQARSINPANTP
jgi:Protein of unknown function (DUF3313)